MHERTCHPHLAAVACRAYELTLCVYPCEFRHAFRQELLLTFRNRVEDVLDSGGVLDWLGFAAHIVVDAVYARCTLISQTGSRSSISLLGLTEGQTPRANSVGAAVDPQLVFRMVGFLLAGVGCYVFFLAVLASVS